MLRIAICDDNEVMCKIIEEMILEYCSEHIKTIQIFNSGDDLIEFMQVEYKFDLIFLDIELGTISGVEVGKTIRNELDDYISKIVFVSASEGYEKQLLELNPLNFLSKPIDKIKLNKCIDITLKLLNMGNTVENTKNKFEYQVKGKTKLLNTNDILYFENQLRKVKIVTTTEEDLFYDKLSNVLPKLPEIFIAPHSSYIVNYNFIEKISGENLIMSNGLIIPISRKNLKLIQQMQMKIEKELN